MPQNNWECSLCGTSNFAMDDFCRFCSKIRDEADIEIPAPEAQFDRQLVQANTERKGDRSRGSKVKANFS
jgi:hypothetical protein